MMPQARQQIKYLLSDFITLNIGWLLFDVARFYTLPADLLPDSLVSFLRYPQLLIGQIVVPVGMIALYAVSGSYNKGGTLYRSRLDEFLNTALISLIGMLAVFLCCSYQRQYTGANYQLRTYGPAFRVAYGADRCRTLCHKFWRRQAYTSG